MGRSAAFCVLGPSFAIIAAALEEIAAVLRDKPTFGSGKDPQTIGIDALSFLASDPDLLRRFLDISGLTADQLRQEARRPAFFVGLLDFILAHEPTVTDFAGAAGLDPAEVSMARDKLAGERQGGQAV